MGGWLSKVIPDLGFFKNSTIKSNCCNNTQEVSFTECVHCRGSGKLFIKPFEKSILHNNIDARSKP
jgi:hypothetical protein